MDLYNRGEELACIRNIRAKELKEKRQIGRENNIDRATVQKIIKIMHPKERMRKPTIADYLNLTVKNGVISHVRNDEDGGWRRTTLLIDRGQDDETVLDEANMPGRYYRGPGQAYAHDPCIERNGHSILVTQRGGLDI